MRFSIELFASLMFIMVVTLIFFLFSKSLNIKTYSNNLKSNLKILQAIWFVKSFLITYYRLLGRTFEITTNIYNNCRYKFLSYLEKTSILKESRTYMDSNSNNYRTK